MCWLSNLFKPKQTLDLPSPSDIFTKPDWAWSPGAVYWDTLAGSWCINKSFVTIPFSENPKLIPIAIADTKSEDPVFDSPHHCLVLDGATKDDHNLMVNWIGDKWLNPPRGQQPDGNILVYYNPSMGLDVIHRMHKVTLDSTGRRLWQFKGDNPNVAPDPGLVTDAQIKWLVAAIFF